VFQCLRHNVITTKNVGAPEKVYWLLYLLFIVRYRYISLDKIRISIVKVLKTNNFMLIAFIEVKLS